MTYLLDTCVISELLKPRPDQRVIKWIDGHSEESMYLSALTVGEIQKGIAKLSDTKRKAVMQHWLDTDLRERFSERIISIDVDVAATWGQIEGQAERQGRPIPTIDGLLGATAIAHNLTVVTRDAHDIGRTGARVVDPWKS